MALHDRQLNEARIVFEVHVSTRVRCHIHRFVGGDERMRLQPNHAGLNKLNWEAISSRYWFNQKDAKQAEFLIEKDFPFNLFEQVGVYSKFYLDEVNKIINTSIYTPTIKIQPQWYY